MPMQHPTHELDANDRNHSCHTPARSFGFRVIAPHFLSTNIRTLGAVVWSVFLEWKRRSHSRQMLKSLNLRDIRDFCPDLMKAERESGKPFWCA
jgi:hypothetical protein